MIIPNKNNIKIITPYKLIAICLALAFALFMVIYPHYMAKATANANNFQPGRIIDDSVFTNVNSMNVTQIQAFLNSKVSSCDTNGTQPASYFGRPDLTHAQYAAMKGWAAPPYTCLKDYSENSLSASQIIYNAAQNYQINPQVLIVLLQKEQGLVTDTWPLSTQYVTATGYGCPDSTPGVCNSTYYGFTAQVKWASTLFRSVLNNSQTWYSPYTLGSNYVRWNPNSSCNGTAINIQNRSTQALYDYTPYQPNAASLAAGYGTGDSCSSYGNRNFYLYFNDWFGSSSYSPPTCDSALSGVSCVWELYNPNTDYNFLTASSVERDNAVTSSNYVYSKKPFYAFTSQQPGTIPVYRIRTQNEHFYTASVTERDSLLQNSQNTYEGVAFYSYPTSATTNASYPIYRLSITAGHVFTSSLSTRNSLIANGYTDEGIAFNSPSRFVSTPDSSQGTVHVYRLANGVSHIYTTDLFERDSLLSKNWLYEGTLMDVPSDPTASPIYRLTLNGDHIFTQSIDEKTSLVASGWSYEGIGWYIDSSTPSIYRFYSNSNQHFFTSSLDEALSINNNGYHFEGIAFGSTQSSTTRPIYRFNDGSGHHFFTTNLNESFGITNTPWKYEGVGWYANASATTTPVFRMVDSKSNHFFTASATERDQLLSSNTGWVYEGVGWYANASATTTPVFRMVDSKSNHFFTASATERDQLLSSNTGWVYEGVGWYNP
jgi:hypothetical protein